MGSKKRFLVAQFCLFSFFVLLTSSSFAQSLTLSANPTALTIYPGQHNVPIAVSVGGGDSTAPVAVTLTGLPTGITVTPLTLTAGGSGTLYLNASVAAGQEGFSPTGASLTS